MKESVTEEKKFKKNGRKIQVGNSDTRKKILEKRKIKQPNRKHSRKHRQDQTQEYTSRMEG